MENTKNKEIFEKNAEQIQELFKDLSTEGCCETWIDTFDVVGVDEKQITIVYHGNDSIKQFKKECKKLLLSCAVSIMGTKRKVKILKETRYNALSPKMRKNIIAFKYFVIGMFFVCFATAIIVIMCNYIGNRNFRETFYTASSIKIDSQIRVLHLSDLHGCSYGKDNEKLLQRVEKLKPDIIICTGDIVNSATKEAEYAASLAQKLSVIAPSYYVYGNNEVESIYDFAMTKKELDEKFGFNDDNRDETKLAEIEDAFEKKLENAGIKVLKNEKDTISVNGMTVDVYGVLTSNPSSFWHYAGNGFAEYLYENPDNIKITAVHEPIIFEELEHDYWGDLIVCGHTHGGVVRVPVLGPLYTKESGLFPERNASFVYGRYDVEGSPLFVSSGLENNNLLRLNNQPELVVVDINKF